MIVYCVDRPGTERLRTATRPAHLEYMIAVRHRIAFGGPLRSDAGTTIGSVLAIEVEDRAELEAFLAAEPYVRAGLFARGEGQAMVQRVPGQPPGRLDAELELARGR
nr:YciI family protein [Micromonospora sp. DSM 115978]